MIEFLDASIDKSLAIPYSYDALLVFVSYVVAALGSFSGLLMSRHIGVTDNVRRKQVFLIAGGITMGISVWAMHFIGMLAVIIPIPITYAPSITALSALPAILASTFALYVMSGNKANQRRYVIAGTLIGAGIGTMHYTGMAAMRMNSNMLYDPSWFVLSIVVAVILGIAAISSHSIVRHVSEIQLVTWLRLLSAGLMGLAISGMHYTAMAATYFFPTTDNVLQSSGIDEYWLSTGVVVIVVTIVSLAVTAVIVDRRMQSVEKNLEVTQHRLKDILQNLTDGYLLFDDNRKLVMCNDSVKKMYPQLSDVLQPGTSFEEIMRNWAGMRKQLPANLDVEGYIANCLLRISKGQRVDDETDEDQLPDGRWIYIRLRPVEQGGMVSVWMDVTPIKELQNLYEKLAYQDNLTGLPNRHLFEDRLEHAGAHAKRLGKPLALLYIDLDGFKPINDEFGHETGDRILKEVAGRLKDQARLSDTVARLGGDEFAVLLEPSSDEKSAKMVAERILQSLSDAIRIGDEEHKVGVSIGIGITRANDNTPGRNFDQLIRIADAAMYEAKRITGSAISLKSL